MRPEVIMSKNKLFIKCYSTITFKTSVKVVNLDNQKLNKYYKDINEMPDEERCEMTIAEAVPKALRKLRQGSMPQISEHQY